MKRKKFLVQCHWQNPNDLRQTHMIAQGEFTDGVLATEWCEGVFLRDRDNRPSGWMPMIVTSESEYFVLAATPA